MARTGTNKAGRMGGWRLWAGLWAAASVVTLGGCVKGVGEACGQNAECVAGLACVDGACATCGEGTACVAVDLVVKGCKAEDNPLAGVTDLRFTILGDDLPAKTQSAKISDKTLSMPLVPFGRNRRIIVEGYESADPAAALKARGMTQAFDVDKDTPVPSLTVFLRRVLAFSSALSRSSAETSCSALSEPRAGHSATLLKDGRVLVAGGYAYDASGKKSFLKSAEIYDPKDGVFKSAGANLNLARAGHTATLLPGGRVLLAGGSGIINGQEVGLAAELFDPATSQFIFLGQTQQMSTPRTHHAAAMLPNGVVLISGGKAKESDAVPLDKLEMYDPSRGPNGAFVALKDRMGRPRADHAAIAVGDDTILLVGGTDGTSALNTVEVWKFLGGTFVPASGASYSLSSGRSNPFAFTVGEGDSQGVLVLGSPASGTQNQNDALDWLAVPGTKSPSRDLNPLPTARKDACAAAFEGGAVVVGGKTAGGTSYLASADYYTTDPSGKLVTRPVGPMAKARAKAACTTLSDGGVLVTGGEAKNGSTPEAVGDAEVFEPR